MFIIILVVKVSIIQGMVGRGEAQLPPAVKLMFPLLSVELGFFQQAAEEQRFQVRLPKNTLKIMILFRAITSRVLKHHSLLSFKLEGASCPCYFLLHPHLKDV